MEIIRFQMSYGPEVASHHRLALPNGFLSHLGDRFLAELYLAIDNAPRSAVWIALDDSKRLIGFLSGTASVRACYRHVLMNDWLRLTWRLVPSLASPKVIKRALETALYPFRSSAKTPGVQKGVQAEAELLSVAVSEQARGMGVGRGLVEAFEHELREWGHPGEYRVVTDSEDSGSNEFYLAVGFRAAGSFHHHGHLMSIYAKSAQGSPVSNSHGLT